MNSLYTDLPNISHLIQLQFDTADHKPTILLIPGAWHKGSTFDPVATILRDHGYKAETITLPSAGGPPSTTAYDDAEHIQTQYLDPLVSSEKEVILVMHSYAGVPGTESVKGFARKDRAEQGKRGGVVGLIYLSAFIIPAGASVATLLPGGLDSFMTMDGDMMMPKNPREKFYNDLDDATAQMYLADIVPHAPAAMSTPLTYAAYRDVDTSYIFCTKDTGFPLVGQQKIASIAGKDRVHTYSVDAGHFAMLSRPGDVAKAVMDVARRVVQN